MNTIAWVESIEKTLITAGLMFRLPAFIRVFSVEKEDEMRHYDHYFFDLDGTLIHGKALLPKAADLITYLYEQDKQVFF